MTKEELKSKLNEFIEALELDELATKTVVSYRNAINKFIEYVPDRSFELDKKLIMSYKIKLQEDKYALKSRNQYVKQIFNIFGFRRMYS